MQELLPHDAETARRWFHERGLRLDLGYLADEAYADVTDPSSAKSYGSYVRGLDTDEVASEAVRRWIRHHTAPGGWLWSDYLHK